VFSRSVELYDAIYTNSKLKDYRAEAAALASLIRQRRPAAATVLDVACGTGEHAKYLSEEFGFRVDGVDIEPGFVSRSAAKVPGGTFYQADMRDFALDARYDVVTCLFSAIGYLRSGSSVERALRRFRAHANPGGLVIVEPWFEPEQWHPGRVTQVTVEIEDGLVCRVTHAGQRGRTSVVDFHYLVATAGGIEHRSEVHRLRLFTQAEMMSAFAAAGLQAEYEPQGLTGRGLYLAGVPPLPSPELPGEPLAIESR
jgi:ubiquinone/menaquinone biosynthesis C-methylase UbiE